MSGLEIKEIQKSYGKKKVLKDISLSLTEGVYGILGPNGAGKTTLLNIIASVLKEDDGSIVWNGKDVHSNLSEYRQNIGFLPQHMSFYPNFTARDFMEYMSVLKGISFDGIESILEKVHLIEVIDTKIKSFSGGMRQRLGIAQALLGHPKIVLLDEPTVGLDLEERASFKKMMKQLGEEAIVLLSTHIVSDVKETADKIVFLKQGAIHSVLDNGEADDLEEYYLGIQ